MEVDFGDERMERLQIAIGRVHAAGSRTRSGRRQIVAARGDIALCEDGSSKAGPPKLQSFGLLRDRVVGRIALG